MRRACGMNRVRSSSEKARQGRFAHVPSARSLGPPTSLRRRPTFARTRHPLICRASFPVSGGNASGPRPCQGCRVVRPTLLLRMALTRRQASYSFSLECCLQAIRYLPLFSHGVTATHSCWSLRAGVCCKRRLVVLGVMQLVGRGWQAAPKHFFCSNVT